MALAAPWVGRMAQRWGRRPFLLAGFGALAIRGLLFSVVTDPYLLVAVQIFDGITAAVFAVMIPLIVADVAFGSGHFNLAQGIVGTATGIGASLSTVLAGYAADRLGTNVAFMGLAGVAATGLLMILLVMPETRRGARDKKPGEGFSGHVSRDEGGVHASMLCRRWRLRSTIWRAPENPSTPLACSCESARDTVSSVRPR